MLAQKMGVDMPIVNAIYRVLYEEADANDVLKQLLVRHRRPEMEDAGWM
jgi:glycerol-3-phosphate dehydrogenase (NAD(P)+)